jgi:hypothetical protein|tara:strand:+ start:7854 stop:8561 length:708 start_codon:yes stop_codon:yes gene_type:complete
MNILVQKNLNKFTNNISLLNNEHTIYNLDIEHQLYRLHDVLNINCAIFTMSKITTEIIQYIVEFHNSVKIIVYHDHINTDFIDTYHKQCVNLVQDHDSKNAHKIPNLLNEQVFIPSVPKNIKHEIVTFFDNTTDIPEELSPFLYPENKSSEIKIFNAPKLQHIQNLGMLSEPEKNTILNHSKFFVAVDNAYVVEAIYLGCKVLTVSELNTKKAETYTKIPEYTTYNNYLKVLLNE